MKKEKMNEGLESFTIDNLNKWGYFARRNIWARPFVTLGAIIYTVCGGDTAKEFKEVMEIIPEEVKNNKIKMFHLICKMMHYRYHYEYRFREYIFYDFENINHKQRLTFINSFERFRIYGLAHSYDNIKEFANKYSCYNIFKKYYKRDVLEVSKSDDLIPFSIFVNSHEKFIFKPYNLSCGEGIMVIEKSKADFSMKTLFKSMLKTGGVLEEYVEQDDGMAVFHPESVNTIRLTTYHNGDITKIYYAMLRVGRGENSVDNAAAGGITAAIDLDTGRIISDGYCEDTKIYRLHPDTGKQFKDSVIPKWEELLEMVYELVEVVPDHKIVGWDLALSKDKGWLLIEANSCPGMAAAQMCHRKGFRPLFEETIMNDIPNGDLYIKGIL